MASYKLLDVHSGGTILWQIVGNSDFAVTASLKGPRRTYFSERVKDCTMRVPNVQGAKRCLDQILELTLSPLYDDQVRESIEKLYDEKGRIFGRAFHYTASDKSFHIDITYLNPPETSKDKDKRLYICEYFYKYLTMKDKYQFNYLSDKQVIDWYDSLLERPPRYINVWYEERLTHIHSDEDEFKLTLAVLLYYDRTASMGGKIGYHRVKDLMIAFGEKIWAEPKTTVASCPFNQIRGLLLEDASLLPPSPVSIPCFPIKLFSDGTLRAAASHGRAAAKLNLSVSRPLGFENAGLHVEASSLSEQRTIIEESIKSAAEGHAGVLIFPELSINGDTVEFLLDSLKQYGGDLKLVVGGSHYTADEKAYNTAPIFVNDKGWRQVASYNKIIPFSMGYSEKVARDYHIDTEKYPLDKFKTLSEDIIMEDKVTILPFEDCVVGVAICRDVLDLLDKHNPLHKYCDFVDVMLVISDNNGDTNMFVGTAECLARWHNCATVYTNSVAETGGSASPDTHLEVSFALHPLKGKNVVGSTLVRGEITYIKLPFNIPERQPTQLHETDEVKYAALSDKELKNCCKIYELKAPEK